MNKEIMRQFPFYPMAVSKKGAGENFSKPSRIHIAPMLITVQTFWQKIPENFGKSSVTQFANIDNNKTLKP